MQTTRIEVTTAQTKGEVSPSQPGPEPDEHDDTDTDVRRPTPAPPRHPERGEGGFHDVG